MLTVFLLRVFRTIPIELLYAYSCKQYTWKNMLLIYALMWAYTQFTTLVHTLFYIYLKAIKLGGHGINNVCMLLLTFCACVVSVCAPSPEAMVIVLGKIDTIRHYEASLPGTVGDKTCMANTMECRHPVMVDIGRWRLCGGYDAWKAWHWCYYIAVPLKLGQFSPQFYPNYHILCLGGHNIGVCVS